MGAFAYIIPSAPGEEGIFICIDLVLPMGWVDSPKFLCAFSETMTDVENAQVKSELPVPSYNYIPWMSPALHTRSMHINMHLSPGSDGVTYANVPTCNRLTVPR